MGYYTLELYKLLHTDLLFKVVASIDKIAILYTSYQCIWKALVV